ncbi:MAG TPA: hypothetical protein VH541_01930 [Gaiellaceae bacterium]|jgi:hypothetical protein
MHHHHHRHGRQGGQQGRLRFRRPFPNRQELLERLESYQRDVEQELADLDDLIRHLRGNGGGEQTQAAEPAQV